MAALKGIQVEVGQLATLDVSLRVGEISTVVSVSAGKVILLETESNAIGTVVDSAQVESLPWSGRDFLQLALMTGGSNAPTGRSDVLSGQVGHPNRGVIIDGNMATTTGYTINGIATRGGRLGESALNPSIASIDQFKVQESFFMPDQHHTMQLVETRRTLVASPADSDLAVGRSCLPTRQRALFILTLGPIGSAMAPTASCPGTCGLTGCWISIHRVLCRHRSATLEIRAAPLNGPGVNNWDLGVGKTFSIREQTKIELRGEFFNAFNHAQFGLPSADTGSGVNVGRVSSARNPRLIQLGMKLLF